MGRGWCAYGVCGWVAWGEEGGGCRLHYWGFNQSIYKMSRLVNYLERIMIIYQLFEQNTISLFIELHHLVFLACIKITNKKGCKRLFAPNVLDSFFKFTNTTICFFSTIIFYRRRAI